MGYDGDDRHGDERWRDRDHDQNWNRDRGQGREQGRSSHNHGGRGGDDRGFIDRAGDELRSWFGDDDAQRRREMDQRRWEQEQRMSGRRDNDSGPGTLGGGGFGTGWGNQAGESWNRERPGTRGWAGGSRDQEGFDRGSGGGDGREGGGRSYGGGEREGWFSDSVGGERGQRQGGSGGGYGGGSYGGRSSGPSGSSGFGASGSSGFGAGGGQSGGDIHDPHYSEWRRRQIEDLDRDYDEYRREHQSKFETEFGSWRTRRQGQRQSVGKAMPHMEVVGSDGSHVGTVDKVAGDRIILTRSDANAGGIHHSVPCSWIETVEDKVTLNKSAEQAMTEWRNEERGRALFERDNPRGGEGPHVLDRSFSGTYSDSKSDADRDRDRGGEPERSGGRNEPEA
jgi:hypothetical protein